MQKNKNCLIKIQICALCSVLCALCSVYAGTVFDSPMPTQPPQIQASMFSSNIDLEIVTGLRARQYRFHFERNSTIVGSGLELFVLDEFPCFSQNQDARIWIAPGTNIDKSVDIQLTCVYAPVRVQFAWRNVKKNAPKGVTTGLLECAIKEDSTDVTIDLGKCEKKKEWKNVR